MESIARVELGMSYTEFYSLTWYDWTGCMEQIHHIRKNRLEDHEVMYDVYRRLIAQYFNWNRGTKQEASPEDVLTLSWDKKTDTRADASDEAKLKETIALLEQRAKRRINRKRGG